MGRDRDQRDPHAFPFDGCGRKVGKARAGRYRHGRAWLSRNSNFTARHRTPHLYHPLCGTEDIGLGTLWDESLKQNFVIEEHRELNNAEVTTKNYLDVAGAWGKRLGRLPQAGVFSPDHAPDGGVDDVDIENGLAREQQEEKSDR